MQKIGKSYTIIEAHNCNKVSLGTYSQFRKHHRRPAVLTGPLPIWTLLKVLIQQWSLASSEWAASVRALHPIVVGALREVLLSHT